MTSASPSLPQSAARFPAELRRAEAGGPGPTSTKATRGSPFSLAAAPIGRVRIVLRPELASFPRLLSTNARTPRRGSARRGAR